MKKLLIIFCCILRGSATLTGQEAGTRIYLNGMWDFEQTLNAFPPEKFSRKCPVPGLIHLAEPRIEAYDKLFQTPSSSYTAEASDYRKLQYEPKYSWYRKSVTIPATGINTEVMLTILKSQFVTQVYVNGHDMGQSIACATPFRIKITDAIRWDQQNEILVRVGERVWLPPQAAGGTDKEKANYIPGIWDEVFISFSGKQKIIKAIFLPSVSQNTVTAKFMIRNFHPQQVMYGDPMNDSAQIKIIIKEKKTGRILATASAKGSTIRDNETELTAVIPVSDYTRWTPCSPFLYIAEAELYENGTLTDRISESFGMREFERIGQYFFLNGEKIILRGTNITLHRFFEDPECQALPWDKEWVKKMLIDDPRALGWNAMRICVGLVPDFWYDLADEYGMMFQNEWMYWQNHGWDNQIREEYTDWVWSDGNHPSIVIWDAINENWNSFIGNTLIPELEKLDPTRIWDAGYMVASDLSVEDNIDEPHPYRAGWGLMNSPDPAAFLAKNPYQLGKLDDWEAGHRKFLTAAAAQLVNEYGWNWLWRDGQPAKLTKKAYDLLVGENATPSERRELQAYWLQCETEWLRAERSFAGVLAFTHLTNNYGFTGDWYINSIRDLEKGPVLKWYRHAFAPVNVFIDLADQRYFPNGYFEPGTSISVNLAGVNDNPVQSGGRVELSLIRPDNRTEKKIKADIIIPPYGRTDRTVELRLPSSPGGYLLITRFTPGSTNEVLMSRRYIRVGTGDGFTFPSIDP
jgi:beta-galactosidase